MKQIDQDTIMRIGIPSVVLMERAALAVTEAVVGLDKSGAGGIAAGRNYQNNKGK